MKPRNDTIRRLWEMIQTAVVVDPAELKLILAATLAPGSHPDHPEARRSAPALKELDQHRRRDGLSPRLSLRDAAGEDAKVAERALTRGIE